MRSISRCERIGWSVQCAFRLGVEGAMAVERQSRVPLSWCWVGCWRRSELTLTELETWKLGLAKRLRGCGLDG